MKKCVKSHRRFTGDLVLLLHKMMQSLTWARCWMGKIESIKLMPSPVGMFAVKCQITGINAIWDRTFNINVTITWMIFVKESRALFFRRLVLACLLDDVEHAPNCIGSSKMFFSRILLHRAARDHCVIASQWPICCCINTTTFFRASCSSNRPSVAAMSRTTLRCGRRTLNRSSFRQQELMPLLLFVSGS